MHVHKFLSRWLEERNVIGHKMRAESLCKAVESLIGCGRACLTALGRNRAGNAKVKHQIKAVDRLLGSDKMQREVEGIYRAVARAVLARIRRPVIAVDWSDFESVGVREWAMLKAGVVLSGRSFVVYSRVPASTVVLHNKQLLLTVNWDASASRWRGRSAAAASLLWSWRPLGVT